MPSVLCGKMTDSLKAYSHSAAFQQSCYISCSGFIENNFSFVIVCVGVCVCLGVCLRERGEGGTERERISPGHGDTGIRGDELRVEEAVIEVFKKVRGD